MNFALNLTVVSKDKMSKISMPNISSTDGWSYPRTNEQVEEVKACINAQILNPLKKAIKG
jgi:hypothetical protein